MDAILIRGGRVVDPAQGIDRVADVLLRHPSLAGCWDTAACGMSMAASISDTERSPSASRQRISRRPSCDSALSMSVALRALVSSALRSLPDAVGKSRMLMLSRMGWGYI